MVIVQNWTIAIVDRCNILILLNNLNCSISSECSNLNIKFISYRNGGNCNILILLDKIYNQNSVYWHYDCIIYGMNTPEPTENDIIKKYNIIRRFEIIDSLSTPEPEDLSNDIKRPKKEKKEYQRKDWQSVNNENLFDRQLRKLNARSLSGGWPDRLVFIENKVFAVEIKNPKEKLRLNQVRMLEALRELGIKCFVFRGEKHFWENVIKEINQQCQPQQTI